MITVSTSWFCWGQGRQRLQVIVLFFGFGQGKCGTSGPTKTSRSYPFFLFNFVAICVYHAAINTGHISRLGMVRSE